MNKLIGYILRLIILSAFQIFILNNLQISGYLNPYVYILFIMLLPPKLPKPFVLIISFSLGFMMDIFSDSYGIHTAATVLLGYIRPKVLSLVSVKGGEDLEEIGIRHLRFGRFFTYSITLILIHHFALFYLEAFRLNEFFDTLVRAFTSGLFSLLIIISIESLRSN